MRVSKITIFAGHYGSGKTVLAVNYALRLKQSLQQVTLCDLDIVNPYFRAADFIPILNEQGVRVIASEYANSNVDMPSVPAGTQAAFDTPGVYTVVDLGGDDRGALALGRYAKRLNASAGYQMFLVFNPFRPLTRGVRDVLDIKDEIESASGVKFTGIVNNPNLGADTTEEHVLSSYILVEELSRKTGLPHVFTSVNEDIIKPNSDFFPIKIYKKPHWKVD